jgi:orotidine-5'-phosphate decarboxylase
MAMLIVAMDVANVAEAEEMVERIGPAVGFYKIGLELFSAAGPDVVTRIQARGKHIFLDLKLHDIPRTVERAVTACGHLGVDLLTIHSSGGRAMIQAAHNAAAAFGEKAPKIVAVTMLTSLDQKDVTELGISRPIAAQVETLGMLALSSGADGIVCSPHEVAAMRRCLGPSAVLVTPGVRPAGAGVGDQKRVATPAQAVRDGANYLVVGRPILEAADPRAAAVAILEEMQQK